MAKRFVFFGLLMLVALFVFLQSRSSEYRVERTVRIAASQQAAFAALDDLHQWPRWSPWEALDPQQKRVFSGPEQGRGSSFAWEGNPQVGKGRLAIDDEQPPRAVSYKVTFEAPMQAEMTYEFTVTPDAGGCRVAWAFEGTHPMWAKLFMLFNDLDRGVGNDMQRGLHALKALVEQTR